MYDVTFVYLTSDGSIGEAKGFLREQQDVSSNAISHHDDGPWESVARPSLSCGSLSGLEASWSC